ncbi:hypothetical protein [Oenococcus oeni]|uniref:hypothetical protein n=1 Tax=Oenococcus oeni TaxID=1247 RepID=UPI0010B7B350|nr:hypothetical protein [Oenococcus oeni]SYW15857.1 conserved hypothetical protein [Oenococcus oeni]
MIVNNLRATINQLTPAAQTAVKEIISNAKENDKAIVDIDFSNQQLSIADSDSIAALTDGQTHLFAIYTVYDKDHKTIKRLRAKLNKELLEQL